MNLESVFRQEGSTDIVKTKGNEFWRFLSFYKHKWILLVAVVFEIIAGVIPILLYWGVSKGVTSYVKEGKPFMVQINDLITMLSYFVIAMLVINGLSQGFRAVANPTCANDIRCAIFKNLMKQEISYFDSTTTGILVSRISEDVTFSLETYISKFLEALQFQSTIISCLIFSFIISWRMTLISFASYPLCIFVFIIGEYKAKKLWVLFRDSSAVASSKAEEVITSFRTVKSFNNELYEEMLYSKSLDQDHSIIRRCSYVQAIKNSILDLIIYGVLPLIMYCGAWILYKKPELNLEVGNIFVVVCSGAQSAGTIQNLFTIIDDFRKANLSGAKILQLIDRKSEFDLNYGKSLDNIQGKIEFRNVCFHYQTRDVKVLNNLSFIIKPGETVAFVGESGCGKTTTLQLLQRFYETYSGEILIDDVNIKDLSPSFLRSQISIVPQNPSLFSFSILDNIRFSRPDAESDECVQAARIGNSHDFIMELKETYNTEIKQTSLSGGQKQRICISRAILANTPILLMDEATAALDTESEQLVQQSLDHYRNGKTAILVAHRLSTVMNVDKIFVFKEGRIVEQGTHKDLIKNSGVYSDLIKFQLQ